MRHISRSQWYGKLIEVFLNNPTEKTLAIALYGSEVKRIEKKYPQLEVNVGPPMKASSADQRHSCMIIKGNDA